MDRKSICRLVSLVGLFALVISLLPVAITVAPAASWAELENKGITNSGNTHIAPGIEYQGKLTSAAIYNQGLPSYMYTYDGSTFSEVTSDGFGSPMTSSLFPFTEYGDELYIGAVNANTGGRLIGWDGTSPWVVPPSVNGWGEGASSYRIEPLGVVADQMVVCVWDGNIPSLGFRLYSHDGNSWNEIAGPTSPVAPRGLGNTNNEGVNSQATMVMGGAMYLATENTTDGTEVWTYDGQAFNQIGAPGGALWSANHTEGSIAVSPLENKVYMGTYNLTGTTGGELWCYDGANWTQVAANGIDNQNNDILRPLVRGEELYVAVENVLDGCRVYKRNGSNFVPVSKVGLDGTTNNVDAMLTSYDGSLMAFTWNFNGAEVWATPISPSIDELVPDGGPWGLMLQIRGHDFLNQQGTGMVTFDGVEALDVLRWSDTLIEVLVPEKAESGPVQVHQSNGDSNEVNYDVTLSETWFFAEGTTRANANDGYYDEYILLQNPNAQATNVNVEYMLEDGTTRVQPLTVAANSRVTVTVSSFIEKDRDVSALVESGLPILAERSIYFFYGNKWPGGHIVTGLPAPRSTFYFAEGTTRNNVNDGSYEEWLCIQNPTEETATVDITYMLETGQNVNKQYTVEATSRQTVDVYNDVGPDHDVSVLLESDVPVVAERPMYFSYRNKWTGGHDIVGAAGPDTVFYFAEGTTRKNAADGYFEEWITIQNPGNDTATVDITYYTAQEGVKTQRVEVGPSSRETVDVWLTLGDDVDTSFKLVSDVPILAERPMYFDYGNAWSGGHDVMGCAAPKESFYFAEGTTRDNFVTYLALVNTGDNAANIIFDYMLDDGTTRQAAATVEPNTRYTRNAVVDVGPGADFSIRVTSDQPIAAERMMYFKYVDAWPGGHDASGYGI